AALPPPRARDGGRAPRGRAGRVRRLRAAALAAAAHEDGRARRRRRARRAGTDRALLRGVIVRAWRRSRYAAPPMRIPAAVRLLALLALSCFVAAGAARAADERFLPLGAGAVWEYTLH